MARPIWSGTISFGLIAIPVQLYSGQHSVDLHFHMVDGRDKSRIRYERVNSETGKEVPWSEIVKAFEFRKGSYAVIDEKRLKEAAPEATQTIDLESFVDPAEIESVYFDKPYILVPAKKSEKSYVLLREVLQKTGKVAIARVVIRTRQYLAAMMPRGASLTLNLLRFEQEMVDLKDFAFPKGKLSDYRLAKREIDMASQLIDSMTVKWNPADYQDDFRSKLRKVVEQMAKEQDEGVPAKKSTRRAAAKQASGKDVDFMALLKQSLANRGQEKKTGRASRGAPRRRATRKKEAAGKAAGKARG